MSNWLVP
ncbi:hypothetical protein F383_21287 [Gossypium arboreum]|nr:hypothetical protein F383_21287 [Gossypium arboreum]